MQKIAAIVVTFNRKEFLINCISSLEKQTRPLNAIFIVDGPSKDGTPNKLYELGYIKEMPPHSCPANLWKTQNVLRIDGENLDFIYIRLYEDLGGAGGFYTGLINAFRGGFDWFWLMDDDAMPLPTALAELLKFESLVKKTDTFALSSTVIDVDGKICLWYSRLFYKNLAKEVFAPIEFYRKDYFEADEVSFVGMLLSKIAVKKIGLPKKDFFIYYDDTEYSLRIKSVGGRIYVITKSYIIHPFSYKKKQTKYLNTFNNKNYFSNRNQLYTLKKYGTYKFLYIRALISTIILQVMILMYYKNKINSSKLLWLSFIDGLIGKLNRSVK